MALDDRAQVLLDRELVLRGRRDDPGVEDRAVVVDLVAVVEQAARRLGGAVADRRGAAAPRPPARPAPRSASMSRERLVGSLHELDRADDDALERVAAGAPQPRLARGLAARAAEAAVEREAVARERAGRGSCRARAARAWSAFECSTCSSTTCSSNSAGAMSRPRVGDDPAAVDRVARRGRRARRSSGSRSTSGKSSVAAQRDRRRARSRARARAARSSVAQLRPRAAPGRSRRRGR